MNLNASAVKPFDRSSPAILAVEKRLFLISLRSRGLFEDVRCELKRADQKDNDHCQLLSNIADRLDDFISGMDMLKEEAPGMTVTMPNGTANFVRGHPDTSRKMCVLYLALGLLRRGA